MHALRLHQRREARGVARLAWISSGGNIDRAKELFSDSPKYKSIDPAIFDLLLTLAIALFKYWMTHKIDEPSAVATVDEPGDFETVDVVMSEWSSTDV